MITDLHTYSTCDRSSRTALETYLPCRYIVMDKQTNGQDNLIVPQGRDIVPIALPSCPIQIPLFVGLIVSTAYPVCLGR